jgi:hypothetical protein
MRLTRESGRISITRAKATALSFSTRMFALVISIDRVCALDPADGQTALGHASGRPLVSLDSCERIKTPDEA